MHHTKKSRALWAGLVAAMLAGTAAHAQTNTLVTGKRITLPPLGIQQNAGSLPMSMATTPDGKYAIVADAGYRTVLSLTVINTADGSVTGTLPFSNATPANSRYNGLYYGLAVQANANGSYTVYAAQGANSSIAVCTLSASGALSLSRTITMSTGDFPAGLALSPDGTTLYVANNVYNSASVTAITTPGTLVAYNLTTATPTLIGRLSLSPSLGIISNGANFTPTSFPFAVTATASTVYVTSQRDGLVYAVSASNLTPLGTIPTGKHPIALLLNPSGTTLYVANAHSDTVSIVDTGSNTVTKTISFRPAGATNLPGATPVGLALSPDGMTLYAALGDMNAVGVVNLAAGKVTGYIPAGWYPTAVAVAPYRRLLVVSAKGTATRNPNSDYLQDLPTLSPTSGKTYAAPNPAHYSEAILEGQVSLLSLPNSALLTQETAQVLSNNRLSAVGANPLPAALTPASPKQLAGIKHIFYIIKENRTYDQVLGDEPAGNGEPNLTIFGKNITPNQHAIAENYVLLDNFYDCAEVSGDGWPWSTQGLATEYVIRNVPANYSGGPRRAAYDFEGQNNNYPVGGVPTTDPYGQPLVSTISPFAAGGPAIPDVAEAPGHDGQSGGHIWDDVKDAGLTYRNYGMYMIYGFASLAWKDSTGAYLKDAKGNFIYNYTPGLLPENYPNSPGLRPAGHDMSGITDVDFRAYNNDYPDSDAPMDYYQKTGSVQYLYPESVFGHYDMPSRFSEFKREFNEYLAADPTLASYPNFVTIRFNHDHTNALSSGTHSPQAEVADNDYAVGQLADLISHSPIWNSSAIFVVEDDSQAGPDHVDAHRSTAYVISPWIKKNSVDHTFYNTDSLLHTMELLLGIQPMSQYDAVATPILDFDTMASNASPFSAIEPAPAVIADLNPSLFVLKPTDPRYKLVAMSDKMDFAHADKAPALLVNQIIWKSIKGIHSQMPAPRHTLTEAQLHFGLQPPVTYNIKVVKTKAGATKIVKTVAPDGDND